ncbi:UPF0462 protein C4orf33 -like protein [Channa argus]|uniref:UPF0462 protein C4orf33-like protein n=1 Tax=Channa argus TaxID=215402 RepID=A0A6G1PAE3_CHAAH|nr:UPF0462 protein C4orf33 -like protein [Channa argus]
MLPSLITNCLNNRTVGMYCIQCSVEAFDNMRVALGLQFVALINILLCCESLPRTQMEFAIQHTWDSNPVNHDPIRIVFSPGQGGLKMEVFGPFFNDPAAPKGPPSQPFPGLWDYEGGHGQHLILLLSGVGQAFQQQLPMVFSATITGDRWMGEALIPWSYFPPNVNKMNSYAIHGSGEKRTYEALFPIPKEEIAEGQKPNL